MTGVKRAFSRDFSWQCKRCGKWSFVRRKDARRAARIKHPNDPGLAAYQCPHRPDYWHYGHPRPGDRDRGRNNA